MFRSFYMQRITLNCLYSKKKIIIIFSSLKCKGHFKIISMSKIIINALKQLGKGTFIKFDECFIFMTGKGWST